MDLPELHGRNVRLRPITSHDLSRIIRIRGTDEVARRWRGEDLEAEFVADLADPELHQFAIETIEAPGSQSADGKSANSRSANMAVAGMIQFSEEQDPDYRHASIDIFVDPDMHRRGIATDAIGTLVDYLFNERGHHRLVIDPAADNMGAIACYTKVGFRPVGVMRAYERQVDGSWGDGLLMEMLRIDR